LILVRVKSATIVGHISVYKLYTAGTTGIGHVRVTGQTGIESLCDLDTIGTTVAVSKYTTGRAIIESACELYMVGTTGAVFTIVIVQAIIERGNGELSAIHIHLSRGIFISFDKIFDEITAVITQGN